MTHGHRSAGRGHPAAQPQGRCNIRGKDLVAPQQQVETAQERPERHGPIAHKKQYLRFYHVFLSIFDDKVKIVFINIPSFSYNAKILIFCNSS
jgi:hypothetical protein